jgi:hypothetical protein
MSTKRPVQHYAAVLTALRRALSGNVHIAGGAVRDTLLERPIRDVDIFLHDDVSDAAADLLRVDFGYVKVGQWVQYEHFSDPMVARVAKFEKADETIPICLIGLAEDLDVQSNVARFDFGVCMAAWDGNNIFSDERFKRDVETKTFTLCRADNLAQFSYSMVRFQKLTADRYAGWSLTVANEFKELAREHTFRQHWYIAAAGGHFGFESSRKQVLRPKSR